MRIGRYSESKALPSAYPFWPVISKRTTIFEKNHIHCLWLLLINQVVKFQIRPVFGLLWTKLPKIYGEVFVGESVAAPSTPTSATNWR